MHGDPPNLPDELYSDLARDWVAKCLIKNPDKRAGYAELLVSSTLSCINYSSSILQEHPFILAASQREVDMIGWVAKSIAFREAKLGAPPLISSLSSSAAGI